MHIGVDVGGSTPNLKESLDAALKTAAKFLVVPLVHPRYRRDSRKGRSEPLTRSDLLLTSDQWGDQIIGKLSPWLQLDSPHQQLRRRSEEARMKQEDEDSRRREAREAQEAADLAQFGMPAEDFARIIVEGVIERDRRKRAAARTASRAIARAALESLSNRMVTSKPNCRKSCCSHLASAAPRISA